jgi:hypothetical protein
MATVCKIIYDLSALNADLGPQRSRIHQHGYMMDETTTVIPLSSPSPSFDRPAETAALPEPQSVLSGPVQPSCDP